jgi:uncharacterized protein YuzE
MGGRNKRRIFDHRWTQMDTDEERRVAADCADERRFAQIDTTVKCAIRFKYDADVDAAYLLLKQSTVVEPEELGPGIILDFDSGGRIVGVEFLHFTKRFRPRDAEITSARRSAGTRRKRRHPE